MSEEITINLSDNTRRTRAISRVLLFVMPITLIGVGIVADSPAMQWAGFVVTMLSIAAFSTLLGKKNHGLTIAQARRRLDEIEKTQGEI